MTTQPEALRLADAQDCVTDDNCGWCTPCSVAAELRRLAAVEAQRDALLELVAEMDRQGWSDDLRTKIDAAIKAAEGEKK